MGRIKFGVLLSMVSLAIFLNAKSGFAQEKSTSATQESAVPISMPQAQQQAQQTEQTAQAPAFNESDTQWLWGEVNSLDIPNNELAINYFDYETDSEKEIKIKIGDNTTYENVKSLNDIKLNDTISVDYALSPDGKYIAKNISIEKPEETSPLPVPASNAPPAPPATTP